MTDIYQERKEQKLPDEMLYPESAKQQTVVKKMMEILRPYSKGGSEIALYELAVKLWRVTRR